MVTDCRGDDVFVFVSKWFFYYTDLVSHLSADWIPALLFSQLLLAQFNAVHPKIFILLLNTLTSVCNTLMLSLKVS